MDYEQYFSEKCKSITEKYLGLNHSLGWRFLLSSKKTLSNRTPIALITLNPGGNDIPPDHAIESSEKGAAYLIESWKGYEAGKAPLQLQIQELFKKINERTRQSKTYIDLMNNSLLAYYIPFRSPNLKSLPNQWESRRFAFELWSDLLNHIQPTLMICIDRVTFEDIEKILRCKLKPFTERCIDLPTGWGKYNVTVKHWESDTGNNTLVRFPHLSRFKIFGRPQATEKLEKIADEISRNLQVD